MWKLSWPFLSIEEGGLEMCQGDSLPIKIANRQNVTLLGLKGDICGFIEIFGSNSFFPAQSYPYPGSLRV